MLTDKQIEELLDSLTLEEQIGQMLCYLLSENKMDELEQNIKETHAGSVFVGGNSKEVIARATKMLNQNAKVPGMIAADVETGPGHIFPGDTQLPHEMAWGAADDDELIERAHRATAIRCREMGVHWSFSPIVDINYNMNNPVTNIRSAGDRPELVARMGTAAVRGLQKDGLMAAGCKHFPGDGMDDRNQHFCTTVNSLSKEEWMNTYGYVYKEMFKAGTSSVMVAHISLPAYDEKMNDWVGYPPASLSYNLQTKLLKEELGFDGCIVSDALSMVGACACVDYDRLAIEFVKAGGDILLFPLRSYFDEILGAVKSGEIPEERIRDAARRVLKMKNKIRLFEEQEEILRGVDFEANLKELEKVAQEIAEKSICLERNYGDILPLKLQPGDTVLLINIKKDKEKEKAFYACDLDIVEEELKKRGYRVLSYVNPSRDEFDAELPKAAAVLLNCKISSQDYLGGTLRINWGQIGPFWRGDVLKHPKTVFTSFGDPYKLHDFPYLKTYVNAFSYSKATQRAVVKALLGEIPFNGKSPVELLDK